MGVRGIILFLFTFLLSFGEIVVSEGEGCSSDIRRAKKKALKNAKINAVERHIGVLINTKTLIVNGKLMRDIIQTRVLGTVKLIGEPEYGEPYFAGRDQICIKVKAGFEIPQEKINPSDFGLTMLLSRKKLLPGEELYIELSSEVPYYPYLFFVDAKERVFRLLPNPVQDTEKIYGKFIFPTKKMINEGYRIVVFPLPDFPLPQREEILFICTKKKIKAFEEFFPSAFAEDKRELLKLLKIPYHRKVEIFYEILSQIGAENYDMVDDYYLIYNK